MTLFTFFILKLYSGKGNWHLFMSVSRPNKCSHGDASSLIRPCQGWAGTGLRSFGADGEAEVTTGLTEPVHALSAQSSAKRRGLYSFPSVYSNLVNFPRGSGNFWLQRSSSFYRKSAKYKFLVEGRRHFRQSSVFGTSGACKFNGEQKQKSWFQCIRLQRYFQVFCGAGRGGAGQRVWAGD